MKKLFGEDEVRLFLDDERKPYPGWIAVRNVGSLILYMMIYRERVKAVSLDHDLGDGQSDGYDFAKWLVQENIWPKAIFIHSMNPVGANNILQLLNRYAPDGVWVEWIPYHQSI